MNTPYIIRPGDTLYSIANDHGVPLGVLATLNHIENPAMIRAGREILLPSLTTETAEPFAAAPLAAFSKIDEPPINRTLRLAPGQYRSERYTKDLIVLHFTAGSTALGAFQSWQSDPSQVATAYIVDRDGTIHETFPPECWAYHLGVEGPESASHRHDQRSIGIEIVNPGALVQRGDHLYWWPRSYTTPWCSSADASKYKALSFRGQRYWATFTPAQFAVLPALVAWIRGRHKITGPVCAPDKREIMDWNYFRNFEGIASHQNFRADKTDIGPAFDWSVIR